MFNIHNDRENELLQSLLLECKYCIYYNFNNIEKINGLANALYMLEIIEEPIIIKNYYGVIDLKESIEKNTFKI